MKGEQTITFPRIGAKSAPSLSFQNFKAKCPKHPSKEDRKDIMVFQTFNVFPCAY